MGVAFLSDRSHPLGGTQGLDYRSSAQRRCSDLGTAERENVAYYSHGRGGAGGRLSCERRLAISLPLGSEAKS